MTKEDYKAYLVGISTQLKELVPYSVEECHMQIKLMNYVMKELYLLDNEKVE